MRTVMAILMSVLLVGCGTTVDPPEPATPTSEEPAPETDPDTTGDPESPGEPESPGKPAIVETIAEGLHVPWGIAFLDDGTALVTERDTARVLAIRAGESPTVVAEIDVAAPTGEAGLLGIAVSEDADVFLYVSTENDNRVLRTRFAGGGLGPGEVILSGIPNARIHDGGRMIFGPDGYLYVATGDAAVPGLAQDPGSLAGKILRVTTDGDPAPGNPNPDSPVWSLGHRNVQGLAFDDRDRLWASEFGANAWDELNLITAGGNYGWPAVEGMGGSPEYIDPIHVWPPADASPSGLAWSDGHLWMAALRGRRLWRMDADGGEPAAFFTGELGRIRTVVAAPDGTVWLATSNTDGRGDPVDGDDRIVAVRTR